MSLNRLSPATATLALTCLASFGFCGESVCEGEDFVEQALERALEEWNGGAGHLFINCGGQLLACETGENPAPSASGDETIGANVVWLDDASGDGSLEPIVGEFFTVTPLPNHDGTLDAIRVLETDMGNWDARSTDAGVDENDVLFHTERVGDLEYEIPAEEGTYIVSLYFANTQSATAGTGTRAFQVHVEGLRRGDFEHCEFLADSAEGAAAGGAPTPNPFFGFGGLLDPVDQAEYLGAADPCRGAPCQPNGVAAEDDPDGDGIPASEECGNAAAVCFRYRVRVRDGALTIHLREPDTEAGEPASPGAGPGITGISLQRTEDDPPPALFVRGDSTSSGAINLTSGIAVLNWLFLGGPELDCLDAADWDDDGRILIGDAVSTFSWLSLGGTPPAAPAPTAANYLPTDCGSDPTEDLLGCETASATCS